MKSPFALSESKRNYLLKLFELVLAVIAVFWAFNLFFFTAANIQWLRWILPAWYVLFLKNVAEVVVPVLLLVVCPLLAYLWYRRETAGLISSQHAHAVIRGVIRWGFSFFCVFFSVFIFIFPSLFSWSRAVLDDMIASTVSGKYMLEYLLVRSLALRVFLSGSFMLGALFLFFRRTTILGLVIIVFNMLTLAILWITVSAYSGFPFLFILIGTSFVLAVHLLMLHLGNLRNKLIGAGQLIPPVAGMRFRWAMLLLVVVLAGFLFNQSYNRLNKNSQLVGKWKVKPLERNGAAVPAEAWMTDDFAWTTVYVDANDGLRFCSNPYKFDQGPSFFTQYSLDVNKGQLTVAGLRNTGGPVKFRVEGLGSNELNWRGKVGNDEVRMVLTKDM